MDQEDEADMLRLLLSAAILSVLVLSGCSSRSKELKNAEMYVQVNELEKAKALLDMEIQTNPKSVEAYLLLAKVFLLAGDQPEARAAFDKALLLDGGVKNRIPETYFGVAQRLAETKGDDAAPLVAVYLQQAATIDPDLKGRIVDWAMKRARAQAAAGKTVAPITLLRATAKAAPEASDRIAGTFLEIAKTYEERQFLREASTYALEAGSQSASSLKDASAVLRRACVLLPTQDREYARSCLEKAIQWNPVLADDDDVYWLVNVSLRADGGSATSDYLARFPNGKHVAEAQSMKTRMEGDARAAAERTYARRICEGAEDGQAGSVYRDLSRQNIDRFTIDLHPGCFSGYILLPQSWEYYRMEAVNPLPNWWLAYRWYQSKNSGSGENPPLKAPTLATMRHGSHTIRVQGNGQLVFYPIP